MPVAKPPTCGCRVDSDFQGRDIGLLFRREVDDSATCDISLSTWGQLPQCRQIVPKDLHGDIGAGAGQHVVDAMRDRLANGDVLPGSSDTFSRLLEDASGRSFISRRTSISADSTPWTCSSNSARPVRRAVEDFRHTEHQSFERSRGSVRVGEARSRNGDRADRQCALIELRQERSARGQDADERSHQERGRRGEHRSPVSERVAQPAPYPALRRCVRRGSVPDAINRDNNHEHNTGVTVSATTSDAINATTYANPSGRSRRPSTLLSMNSGRKTSATITGGEHNGVPYLRAGAIDDLRALARARIQAWPRSLAAAGRRSQRR